MGRELHAWSFASKEEYEILKEQESYIENNYYICHCLITSNGSSLVQRQDMGDFNEFEGTLNELIGGIKDIANRATTTNLEYFLQISYLSLIAAEVIEMGHNYIIISNY